MGCALLLYIERAFIKIGFEVMHNISCYLSEKCVAIGSCYKVQSTGLIVIWIEPSNMILEKRLIGHRNGELCL